NPTLTIEAVSNMDDDGERTLSLGFSEASSPDGWAVTGVTRTITIEDNDGAPSGPSVGFAQTALTYGTGSITVDISATPETSFPRDIVLNLVSSDAFGSVIAAPATVTLENGETEATLTFSPSAIGGTGTVTLTLADPGADKDPPEPALPAGWTFANHVLTLTPATPPKPNTITVAGFGNNPSPAEGATIGMIVQALQGSGSAAIPPEGIDVSLKVDSVFVDENKGVGEDGREAPGSEFPATLHAPTVPSFLPNSFLPFLPIRTNTYTFTLTAANPTANIFAIISPDDTIEVSEKITVTLAPVSEELPDGWALGTSTYEIEVPADNQRASFVSNLPTAAVEGLSVIDPTTGEVKSAFIVLPFEAGLAKGSGSHIFAVDVTGVDHAGNAITDVYDQVKVTGQVDSGTRQFNVSRNGIVQTTEVGIEIKEDPDAELASTYTVRVDTKGLSGVANSKLTHDITVAPSDNTITFAEPSSGSITEAGGTVTIDVAINHPIPASTGDNNNPSSGPAALPPVPSILIAPAATNTALSEDYTLSVSGGTIKTLPALERDEPEEDIPERYLWTLPTGTGSTTLTVRADGKPGNKNLALDFSAAAPALGWDVSGEKTRAIVLGDRVENTIGFEKSNDTLDEPDTDPSGSTGTAHNVKLQLSATPSEDLTVRFEFSGDADRTTLTGDYSATATHTIKVAEVGVDRRTDYPFSILADETAELEETFTISLAEEQPDLPEGWKIDTANNSYTVTIPANDNS
ncbi:MAG: hypothetical protein OXF24_00005, partial [Hyphomicrobiales bacterium]|nr:hypothetical protein [Hyphomicrobiales bacterium]